MTNGFKDNGERFGDTPWLDKLIPGLKFGYLRDIKLRNSVD